MRRTLLGPGRLLGGSPCTRFSDSLQGWSVESQVSVHLSLLRRAWGLASPLWQPVSLWDPHAGGGSLCEGLRPRTPAGPQDRRHPHYWDPGVTSFLVGAAWGSKAAMGLPLGPAFCPKQRGPSLRVSRKPPDHIALVALGLLGHSETWSELRRGRPRQPLRSRWPLRNRGRCHST